MTYQIKTVHLEGEKASIGEGTPIVRYMKLETLLLMLDGGYVFIPSYAKLGQNDPLETNILLNLPDRWKFWEKYADKIEPRLEKFVHSVGTSVYEVGGTPIKPAPRPKAEVVQKGLDKYVNRLAENRCVWCWNKFRNFSNALWHIYGNRGVAVRSTVRLVKTALIRSGAVRGIVAPISYINHEGKGIPKILTQEENLLRPYLMKSVFYSYEKEVRFVLAAERAIMNDAGGVLIPVDAADFVENIDYSPHFHNKEKSAVKRVVESLRSAGHKVNREPLADSIFDGTPFITHSMHDGGLDFSDLL
jgi:hypothetical protein